jgi:hypothetical protein
MDLQKIGEWVFILGIIIAIVAGLAEYSGALRTPFNEVATAVIVVLGLAVGFLNIKEQNVREFLLAAVALLLVGSAGVGVLTELGIAVSRILAWVAAFVAPAALVVALRSVYIQASKPTTGKK